MSEADNTFPSRRKSASAAASFAADLDRVRRMTMEERIMAALSMPADFSWINPTPTTGKNHVRCKEQH
jgi:hypothetical protein